MTKQTLQSPPISKGKQRQRGIALPFALVMMALILVLGVTFIIASGNDKAIANAQNNDAAARLLAEAAAYRAKTLLRADASFIISGHSNYSHPEYGEALLSPFFSIATPNEKQYVLGNRSYNDYGIGLAEGLNSLLFFGDNDIKDDNTAQLEEFNRRLRQDRLFEIQGIEGTVSSVALTQKNSPQWNYIIGPYGVDEAEKVPSDEKINQRLIGRYAFIGMSGGKIPLAYALDSGYSATPTERLGVDPKELRAYLGLVDETLGTKKMTSSQAETLWGKLSAQSGKYLSRQSTGMRYFPDIFSMIHAAREAGSNLTPREAIGLSNNYAVLPIETYELWRKSDEEPRLYCHRFNIHKTEAEWNKFFDTFKNNQGAAVEFNPTPAPLREGNRLEKVTTDRTIADKFGLYFFDAKDGTGDGHLTAENVRRTLYANLCDYVDEDNTCTYGTSKTQASGKDFENIEYAGLELAPLVNEVALKFKFSKTGERSYTIAFDQIRLETVGMFKNISGMNVEPHIWAVIDVNTNRQNYTIEVKDVSGPGIASSEGYSYKNVPMPTSNQFQRTFESDNGLTVQSIQVRALKIMLYSGGKVVQVAQPVRAGGNAYGSEQITITSNQEYYLNFAANDPRTRFIPNYWHRYRGTSESAANLTMNGRNACCNPDAAGTDPRNYASDPEPEAKDPWDVSTAFIRNGPMESPAEIGYIHRIMNWQTINLKRAKDGAGNLGQPQKFRDDEIAGTGVTRINLSVAGYRAGDATILDQIKWGTSVKSQGKINVNVASEGVARALFTDIVVGKDPNDWSKGVKLEEEDVTRMLPNVIFPVTNRRFSRGSYANAIYNAIHGYKRLNGKVANELNRPLESSNIKWTDAEQESIIGKIACLIDGEAGRDAMVIVVAQSINDAIDKNGDYGTYNKAINRNDESDVVTGQARMMVQFEYQQNVFSNIAPNDNGSDASYEKNNAHYGGGNDWVLKRIIYLDPDL